MGRRTRFVRGLALAVVLVVAGAVVLQPNTEQQANPLPPSQSAALLPASSTVEAAAAPATDPTAPVVESVQVPSPVPVLPDVPSPSPLPPTLPPQQPPLPTREVVQLPVPVEPVANQVVITFNPTTVIEPATADLQTSGDTVYQSTNSTDTMLVDLSTGVNSNSVSSYSVVMSGSVQDVFAQTDSSDGSLHGASRDTAQVFYINGICNSVTNHIDGVGEIASILGKPVMGIYNRTDSDNQLGCLALDGTEAAFMALINKYKNVNSDNFAVQSLVKEIRYHFNNSVSQDLTVVAHSQGALITTLALQTLNNNFAAEFNTYKNRIKVITLGGAASQFPEGPLYKHYINGITVASLFNWTVSRVDPVTGIGVRSLLSNVSNYSKIYNEISSTQYAACPNDLSNKLLHSLCLYLNALTLTGEYTNWGEIGGVVTNQFGQPLSGVTVSASSGGSTEVTNNNGIYRLWGVPSGAAVITATNPNYGTNSVSVNIIAQSSQAAPTIVIMTDDPTDSILPTASWVSPSFGATITSNILALSVNASDNSGGSGIREVLFSAKWNNQWQLIGVDTTFPYSLDWNWCSTGIPNGDIELGLEVVDNAANKWVYSQNFTNIHVMKYVSCSGGGEPSVTDTTPPTASWTSPANGATISARTVGLQVNASDNSGGSGVREVRFSAKVNNTWVSAGNDSSSPYSVDWDLCAAGATDGSVIELGMEVWDNANNKWVYSEHFTNISIRFSYNCSQTPGGTEAILYDDPDYHGEERHFGTGKHDIGSLWNDRAHSLYLPGGWSVRLYADGNFQGQNACFNASTSSLPGPYAEGVSSLQVFNNSTCTDTSQPPIIDCGAVILHDGGGNQLVLTSSVNNLNELGWNDKARYIEIIGPYRAIAYDTENLQGWSHGPFSTGTYTGIGTNVSSVFVEKTGDCNLPPDAPVECTAANPGVYLVDSGGAELRLTASESNLNVRGWNDRPREMYVVGPYRATAYDNENLQGWSHGPLTHGQRQGIGTNVSSVRVELTIDCYNLPRAPEMPGSFAITGSANTSLTMQWANVANETGYRLYKWNGSAYALYQTLAADSTSYTDSGLVCGREYFYQIAAYNGVGESSKASVKGTTVNCPDVVDPVVNLVWPVRYTAFGSDQITLYAEASDDRAVSQLQFFVYYDDLSGASAAQIPAPPLPGETSAQAYNWHVIGYDTDGSDGWSITWDTASAPVDQVLAFWVYAYDTSYRYSSSSVGDIVLDRTLPTGALTMPIEGTYTSSAALWVRANASDSFSGMSSVRFYYWTGSEWGLLMTDSTAPYEYLWNISGFADGWQTVVAVAYDRAGNGSTIGWSSFAVDRAAPVTAVDALPAYQVEPNFTVSWSGWDALLDSYWLTYDVQVQDNCAGGWLDWQINTPNLSADFSGTPGHSYCFRSRSRDVAGNVEAWPLAADASTAVLLPLAAPGTLLPDSQALIGRDDPIVLSWAPVADATGYAVEFWGGNGVALSSGWLTETEWTIPAQVGGVYQWRVRSHDDLRQSIWSSAQALSVRYAPPTAVSVLGYNNYQVSLSWTASADAPDRIDEYVIDFLIDGNFSRRYWAAANATSLVASWLECETTYTVVIRAVNGALESVDSNSNTVTLSECLLLPPSPYDPPNGYSSSNKRPRFQWGASSYATAYEIQIGASDPPTTDPVQVNETHYLIPAPLLNVTYYWRVRALRNGRTSDWSPVNAFTVASDPNAPPELNVYSTTTQVLSWERVSWAAYYEVEWSSTISFNFWDLYYKKVQVWQDVLAVMTDALPTGTYYWRVRAYTSAGVAGAWSAPQSFTLQLP